MSTILDRLMKVINNNPSFKEELEKEFPELKNNDPFIYQDTIFFRRSCLHHVYVLRFRRNIEWTHGGYFYIHNVTLNDDWSNTLQPSNEKNNVPFLTKDDFCSLLKSSGVNLNNIAIIDRRFIQNTAKSAFDSCIYTH